MKNFLPIFSLIAVYFLIPCRLNAQVAITALPFLEINNDARSMGLGGATVALKGSRSGLHLNPAIFGKRNTLELSSQFNTVDSYGFFGTPWLPGYVSDLQIYNPNIIVGLNDLSIGYQFTYIDLGSQVQTDPNSFEIIDRFNSYELAHTFSVSIPASRYVSLGIGLNYFKSSLATGQTISGGQQITSPSALTIDLGVYTERVFNIDIIKITPSLGWSLTDFGYPIRYTENSQKDPLPMLMRGGFGLRLDPDTKLFGLQIMSVALYGSLEKVMARSEEVIRTQAGFSDTSYVAVGPVEALFKSWSPYSRFNGQQTIALNVWDQFRRQSGLEITMFEILSFRFGHYYEHPENGARVYDTFGIGLQYKYFSFDYARIDTDESYHPFQDTDFFQLTFNIPVEVIGNVLRQF